MRRSLVLVAEEPVPQSCEPASRDRRESWGEHRRARIGPSRDHNAGSNLRSQDSECRRRFNLGLVVRDRFRVSLRADDLDPPGEAPRGLCVKSVLSRPRFTDRPPCSSAINRRRGRRSSVTPRPRSPRSSASQALAPDHPIVTGHYSGHSMIGRRTARCGRECARNMGRCEGSVTPEVAGSSPVGPPVSSDINARVIGRFAFGLQFPLTFVI